MLSRTQVFSSACGESSRVAVETKTNRSALPYHRTGPPPSRMPSTLSPSLSEVDTFSKLSQAVENLPLVVFANGSRCRIGELSLLDQSQAHLLFLSQHAPEHCAGFLATLRCPPPEYPDASHTPVLLRSQFFGWRGLESFSDDLYSADRVMDRICSNDPMEL